MKEIPEANENRDNLPCWKGVRDREGSLVPPIVYCECGKPLGLYNHGIDADGVVTPSVWHHEEHENGCGWHWNIKLIGYKDKYQGKSFNKNP